MSADKKNAEGYADPTSYAAMTNVARQERAAVKAAPTYRPLVYICSPYRGNVEENIVNARVYSRFAIDAKAIPITPHLLYPQFMDDNDPTQRELATHTINYVLLGKCSELWVFGSKISNGMVHEIRIAEKQKKKIRYFTEDMREVQYETLQ